MSTETVQAPGSLQTDRIMLADCFAEIIRGTGADAPIFYWIVQRVDSTDVLMWGQETSYEKARASAKSYLQSLAEEILTNPPNSISQLN